MENRKLLPLKLQSLHHAEMGQLAVRFFEDFENAGLAKGTDADFDMLYSALQNLLPGYNAAVDQVQANEESQNIANADRLRDQDYMALKNALKPHRTTRDETERAAYSLLATLFSQYRSVETNAYEEETLRLNNLLAALAAEDKAEAVATLGMQKFVDRLAASNADFNSLFAHRSNVVSQKVSYDVKALRKGITEAYKRMANYTATMADVKSAPFHKNTLAVLNTGRKYFSDVLSKRGSGDNKPPEIH